jgi:hypothetical protein
MNRFTPQNKTSHRISCIRSLVPAVALVSAVGLLPIASCSHRESLDADQVFYFDGSVVDESSLAPLDSAKIQTWRSGEFEEVRYADTLGMFSFVLYTGGQVIPNLSVTVSKTGYVPFDTLIPEINNHFSVWDTRLKASQNAKP